MLADTWYGYGDVASGIPVLEIFCVKSRKKRITSPVVKSQKRPEVYGIISCLAGQLGRVQPFPVVGLFAYLHDVCREGDGYDLQHGERSAVLVGQLRDTLLKDLSDRQIKQLSEACRLHTVEHKTGDPTIDACFDADRLDLGRVGVTPDPERLATEIGKRLSVYSVRNSPILVFEVLYR